MSSDLHLIELRKECLENARDLLEESFLLLKNGKLARAAMVAITSYEEARKASLLLSYQDDLITTKEFNRIFRNHNLKMLTAYAKIRFLEDTQSHEVIPKYILPDSKEEVDKMIRVRSNSLYVDFREGEVVIPNQIKRYTAEKYFQMAKKEIEWEEMFDLIRLKLDDKN